MYKQKAPPSKAEDVTLLGFVQRKKRRKNAEAGSSGGASAEVVDERGGDDGEDEGGGEINLLYLLTESDETKRCKNICQLGELTARARGGGSSKNNLFDLQS